MSKIKMGRKTNEDGARRRVNVMLSQDTIDRLNKMGVGNLSEGIRAYVMGRREPYADQVAPNRKIK